jgi:hypothetical protein
MRADLPAPPIQMLKPTLTKRTLSILVSLLAAFVAGCGGGGDTEPSDGKVAAAEAAESDGPPGLALSFDTKNPNPGIADSASAEPPAIRRALALRATTRPAIVTSSGAPALTTTPLDIFVTTNGNDSWSGLVPTANAGATDGPLRTIGAAQAVARQRLAQMAAGAERRAINVRIGAGEYRLTAPLTFGPTDSGVPTAPVVYRAEQAGTVTISGAVRVGTGTATAAGTLMTLPTPTLPSTVMRGGTQLYVNSRRATLARTPNVGQYWFVQKVIPLASEPAGQTGQEAFEPTPAALAVMNGLSSSDRGQAIVNVMQAWSAGHHRLSTQSTPAGSVRVTPRAKWAFLKFGTDQRFFIENVASALDQAGEWLWDTNGLRYISTAADAGKAVAFDMPNLEQLLIIKGNATTGSWVQDLQFRGLGFAYTRLITPEAGYVDGQAGSDVRAAVEVDAARRIVIDGCSLTRTGGYGIWFRTSVRESTVSNCRMNDLGGGGVKLGLTAQSPTDANGTGLNTVHANIVTDTGKQIPGSVGLWIGQSSDNTVSNNLVANTSYTAISVGWSWSYGTATASRNRVVNNLLINIGQGVLSDLGGIYTLGESPGTVISGNVMHEVRPYQGYGAGAWGMYNDEATTGVLWENNVVVGTDSGGYLLHYGRNNTVRSNLLAYGDRSEVRVTKTDPLTKLAFNNNLLIPKNTAPFVGFATAPDVVYASNSVSSRVLATPASLTMCGTGCTTSNATLSVGADPRVLTVAGARSTTISWVAATGLAAGPPGLTASAVPVVNSTPPAVYAAPPVVYEADIAGTAAGGQPINLAYRTGNSVGAITVQATPGTPTGKGLRFVDSAPIVNRWEPYAWATLNHKTGTTTGEFSIKIDASSNMLHEWRDNANVYLTGPSMRIKPTGIEVNGRVVAAAPIGEWLTLKTVAPLGTNAGTWSLEVRYANGSVVTVPNLPNKNSGWNRLDWLGYASDVNVASTATLGFIRATNIAP